MYISKDFLHFVLFCLASTLCVFLIIASIKLINLIKRVTDIIDINRQNINKVIETLPETAKNINYVSIGLKENVEKLNTTITCIENTASSAATADENSESFFSLINVIMSVAKAIKNAIAVFSKD